MTRNRSGALPAVLWPLLFGNYVIGSGVMVAAGTLNEISADLSVSVASAGQLISVGALVMCVGAPTLAFFVSGWDRRRLLSLSLVWYGLLLCLSAAMPNYAALLPVRALALVAPAIFTPQATACIGLLVGPEQRGRAISFVFLGWALASVLGMPMAALLGGLFGWRVAFASVGVLAWVSAAWVWWTMPDGVRPLAMSGQAWRLTLQSPALMLTVGITLCSSAGQFTLMAYLAPYFKQVLDASPQELSLSFLWFGVFALAGNLLMSRFIDSVGSARGVLMSQAAMALAFALWPLGQSWPMALAVMVPWALGCFAANSAQQARLVGIAPSLASGSVALNSAAMYAGQAIGAAIGGAMVAADQMERLHAAGLAGLLLSIGCSVWAARQRPPPA